MPLPLRKLSYSLKTSIIILFSPPSDQRSSVPLLMCFYHASSHSYKYAAFLNCMALITNSLFYALPAHT